MKEDNVFPYDCDTLYVITEVELYLGLKNKDTDRMSYTELIEYINQITVMLLYK